MKHRLVGLGFGLLFLFVQLGCSDTTTPPFTGGGSGGTAGSGGAVCSDEGGPIVELLEPAATDDPSSADLITDPDVNIRCQVDQAANPVDDSSVAITVYGAGGSTVTPAVSNRGDGVFEATASVASFSNGALRIVCEASSTGIRGACSGAEVNTLLDLGPGIQMLNPAESGAVLSGGVTVRYTIVELPVTESDTTDSALKNSQVVVAGADIPPVSESETDTTETFGATVAFDDPMLYQTPLDGVYQMSVSATNERDVTRTITFDFAVDAEGPLISIEEPELGSVIGGATSVVATVSDASGVDSSQISFYIGSEKFDMAPVPGTAGTFSGSFDANQYPTSVGEVTIDVVAVDVVGNESFASVVVELDGNPPILEMDPPQVREGEEGSNDLECSALFDPVGDIRPPGNEDGQQNPGIEAINDGDMVYRISQIRARVEDRGNETASYKSGLDFESVQVWILRGRNQALVLDSDDADNTCDSLNPDVLPGNPMGNIPAVAIDLIAATPTGGADFLQGQAFGPYTAYGCESGSATEVEDAVCPTTPIPRIIPDNDEPSGTTPAIFVKAPIIPFYCMGDPFDWQTALDGIEGPGCMAVVASDVRGNSSVSQPLRVCFTKTDVGQPLPGGHPCLGFDPGSYTCTDGCNAAKFPVNELIGPFD